MFLTIGVRYTDLYFAIGHGGINVLWMTGNVPMAKPNWFSYFSPSFSILPWVSGELMPPTPIGQAVFPLWIPWFVVALPTIVIWRAWASRAVRLWIGFAFLICILFIVLIWVMVFLLFAFDIRATAVFVVLTTISACAPWLGALAATRTVRQRLSGHGEGHCKSCGYNLTGNVSGRCPECGTVITDPPKSLSSNGSASDKSIGARNR